MLKLAPETLLVLVLVLVLAPEPVLVATLVPAVPVSAQASALVVRLPTLDSHQACIYCQGLAQPDQSAA